MVDLMISIFNAVSRVHPPELLGGTEVHDVVQRLYTAEMKAAGIRGSVRVVVSIDEHGRVTTARAIRLPSFAGGALPVLVDGASGRQLPAPPPYTEDPELRKIAEAAAVAQRFRPARRGDKAVRYRGYICSFVFDA
jgi:hypothetical protein